MSAPTCQGRAKRLTFGGRHANALLWNGNRVDLVETLPASLKMLNMAPDNPGTWLYHCHVNDHLDVGMTALYTVYS